MPQSVLELILQMKQQGFDDYQIIQSLQQAGYDQKTIVDGISQAQLKQSITGPTFTSEFATPQNPMQPNYNSINQPFNQLQPSNRDHMEEMIESIVEEKWADLIKNVEKILVWKEKVEERLTTIEADFKNMKETFDKLHSNVLSKVGEYDQNIKDVGTEIQALEKVFQKLLPTFTQNVNELARITKELKK